MDKPQIYIPVPMQSQKVFFSFEAKRGFTEFSFYFLGVRGFKALETFIAHVGWQVKLQSLPVLRALNKPA